MRIIDVLAALTNVQMTAATPMATAKIEHWTKWSNDWLVRLLTSNIYRSWAESMESFEYLLEPSYGFSAS